MIPTIALLSLVSVARSLSGPADLVVHEWGTFTSMQGSDGATLEGLQHEEEALPRFVHRLDGDTQFLVDGPEFGIGLRKGIARALSGVTVKMETPVTYFYAPHSLALNARVELVGGVLSEWYPHARPELVRKREWARGDPAWLDFRDVERGSLEWDVQVLAPGLGLEQVPAVEPGDPWIAARIPAANCVRAARPTSAGTEQAETEEFLFYRGLGRFDQPVRATTRLGARLQVENTSPDGDVLTHVFALHVRGGRGAFAYAPSLAPGAKVEFVLPLDATARGRDEVVAEISQALEDSLAAAGLFRPEAEAMVETWKQSYFESEGLRVLYVLPQRLTDAILPLEIAPRPRATVRVLVGRLECLTPEFEAEVTDAVREFGAVDPSDRLGVWDRIERCGRFLEPVLRRVDALTDDPEIEQRIADWLDEYGW